MAHERPAARGRRACQPERGGGEVAERPPGRRSRAASARNSCSGDSSGVPRRALPHSTTPPSRGHAKETGAGTLEKPLPVPRSWKPRHQTFPALHHLVWLLAAAWERTDLRVPSCARAALALCRPLSLTAAHCRQLPHAVSRWRRPRPDANLPWHSLPPWSAVGHSPLPSNSLLIRLINPVYSGYCTHSDTQRNGQNPSTGGDRRSPDLQRAPQSHLPAPGLRARCTGPAA